MTRQSPQEITQLLHGWRSGDRSALDKLMPLVYDELRRLAHRYMQRERAGHILQTTALVNEVYLQLIDTSRVNWQDRAHFFSISAILMRQILVHFARSRDAQKRGGGFTKISLSAAADFASEPEADLVKLDDALEGLAKIDPRKAKVVELRFFGGMTLEETAEVIKVPVETVSRDWHLAKTWI
jgi:RNA polymerase sigma factor (TIGR02999 family)